jgi:hypothetical protein
MSKINCQAFRNARSVELRNIATILETYGVCLDTGPIQRAADLCLSCKPSGPNSWGYKIESLLFRDIGKPKDSWPKEIIDLTVEFSIDVSGKCLPEDHNQDPFATLAMDVIVRGRIENGTTGVCAWHLDRHIGNHNHGDGSAVHPHYHFQHGGKRLQQEISDSGQALILEAPRIAHPPLDATLGIDFVVSNFKSKHWADLVRDHQYINILRRNQKRCWRAYTQAISNALNSGSAIEKDNDQSMKALHLWPQLI